MKHSYFVPFSLLLLLSSATSSKTVFNNKQSLSVNGPKTLSSSFSPAFELYVSSFFAPVTSFPAPSSILSHGYHVMVARDNPILRKKGFRELFAKLTAMQIDFAKLNETTEPLFEIHQKEQKLRKNECREETEEEEITMLPPELRVCRSTLALFMQKVFNKPRHFERNKVNRERVGGYIYRKFANAGLMVYSQPFRALRPSIGDTRLEGMEAGPAGANIIGVLPGLLWNSSADRPLVLMAHWDAVANSPGFDDNGSGVAMLLEVATILAEAECFVNDHSILFVASDMEEQGCHGSLEFVRKYLRPDFVLKGNDIQGAYVLDTIGNFDPRPHSQTWPKSWRHLTSADSSDVGDFVAVVDRAASLKDRILAEAFTKSFENLRNFGSGKLRRLSLNKLPSDRMASAKELFEHEFFWRSDNARFWFYRDQRDFHPMGAVLLTDTAMYRGYMRECYHSSCDSGDHEQLHPRHTHFVAKIGQALALAAANLTVAENNFEHQCNFSLNSALTKDNRKSIKKKPILSVKKDFLNSNNHSTIEETMSTNIKKNNNEEKSVNSQESTLTSYKEEASKTSENEENNSKNPEQISDITSEASTNMANSPFTINDIGLNEGPWIMERYQPNFGGVQYNIDNINIHMNPPTTVRPWPFNVAVVVPEDKKQKASSWLTRLAQIIGENKANSPMIVQVEQKK